MGLCNSDKIGHRRHLGGPEGGDAWRVFFLFCSVCFLLPAAATIAPGISDAYGPAGGWCWISSSHAFWRFIIFFGPLWAAMVYNLTSFALIRARLRYFVSLQL